MTDLGSCVGDERQRQETQRQDVLVRIRVRRPSVPQLRRFEKCLDQRSTGYQERRSARHDEGRDQYYIAMRCEYPAVDGERPHERSGGQKVLSVGDLQGAKQREQPQQWETSAQKSQPNGKPESPGLPEERNLRGAEGNQRKNRVVVQVLG